MTISGGLVWIRVLHGYLDPNEGFSRIDDHVHHSFDMSVKIVEQTKYLSDCPQLKGSPGAYLTNKDK